MKTPLTFYPVYKDYIWGGSRIPARYARTGAPKVCAESWEISAHPDGESIVTHGRYAGQTLAAMTKHFGADLIGTRAADSKHFPLLFKLIDARERLSVQVHPNERNASLVNGDPKTEMWYVLDAQPNAHLYAGLADNTTPHRLRTAVEKGSAEELLVKFDVRAGEAFFIPGGLVHAIGAGCLIYEVQQNSNTTYRLYDWDRVTPTGDRRPLHIEKSLQAIDWQLSPAQPHNVAREVDTTVIACDFFTLRKRELISTTETRMDGTSFHVIFSERGRSTITASGETITLCPGGSCLIPAAAPSYTIEPDGLTSVLITTL